MNTKNYNKYLPTTIFEGLRENIFVGTGYSVTCNSVFYLGSGLFLFVCLFVFCLVLMLMFFLWGRQASCCGRQDTEPINSWTDPSEWILCSSITRYLFLFIWIIQVKPMHRKACTIICALQVEQGTFSELDSGHLAFSHLNAISKMAHPVLPVLSREM